MKADEGIQYHKDDKLHRVNGPAEVWDYGYWRWCMDGMQHRYYGPSNKVGTWCIRSKMIKPGNESWLK